MTQVQEEKINEFINNLPEDIVDLTIEEINKQLRIFSGYLFFLDDIKEKYEQSKENGKSLKKIAKEVKKIKIEKQEVCSAIANFL